MPRAQTGSDARVDGGPTGLPATLDAIAPPDSDRQPTLFAWADGHDALTRTTRIFYGQYVSADPLVVSLCAGKSPNYPERVVAWLGETFGGPKTYRVQYGGCPHMVTEHLGNGIAEAQQSRQAQPICQAAEDTGLPTDPEFCSAFVSYIEWGSLIALENSQPGARPRWACRCHAGTAAPPRQKEKDRCEEPGFVLRDHRSRCRTVEALLRRSLRLAGRHRQLAVRRYGVFGTGGAGGIEGGVGADQDGGRRVSVYARIDDLQGYLDEVGQLDGKLVTPPTESDGLTFVHVADPAGTGIGIYTD